MRGKPGYHLHRLIRRWFGQKFADNCKCKETIRKMNRWGPAGCREHLDEIVSVMRAEARHRDWWLRLLAAMPGVEYPMQELVLLAIELAEHELATAA
jgi:hypothetical protein